MENTGWVKLHKKILNWGWYDNPTVFRLFIHLLLTVNFEEKTWHNTKIERGQVVIGLLSLSETLGISIQSIRTALIKLKSTHEITIKSTNRFSIITIIKYEDYQEKSDKLTSKSTNKLTNNQQTNNKQLTTTKEYKNIRSKEDIIISEQELADSKQINELLNLFKGLNPMINFGNKTYRKALQELIKKVGYDKAQGTINYAISVQGKPYSPTITTPYQLNTKLGELVAYYKKQKDLVPNIINLNETL